MGKPPSGVVLTLTAVCHLMGVHPASSIFQSQPDGRRADGPAAAQAKVRRRRARRGHAERDAEVAPRRGGGGRARAGRRQVFGALRRRGRDGAGARRHLGAARAAARRPDGEHVRGGGVAGAPAAA